MSESVKEKHCVPCEGGIPPLTAEQIKQLMINLEGWDVRENKEIIRSFHFKNYYHTISFVNAIAWMAHREIHHPDLEVSYNHCLVRFSTHAIGGLSDNDFICAQKVNEIYDAGKR